MQIYLSLAVVSVALVATNAQGGTSDYPGPIPGGETHVSVNKPNVEEAHQLVIQELRNQARTLPGSPSVDITDFDATEQIVAGTRYQLTFKAVYTYSKGEKITKSCTTSVIKPLGSPDGKITFTDDTDGKEKIRCIQS